MRSARTQTARTAGALLAWLGLSGCSLVTKFETTGCVPSAGLLCEDFEDGLDTNKWPYVTQAGGWARLSSAPDLVHRGSHSLHVHSEPALQDAARTTVEWRHDGDLPSTLFLRAFMYWASPVAVGALNNLQIESPSGTEGFALYAGQHTFGWTDWAPNVGSSTGAPPPEDAWTCLEWQLDGVRGGVAVWVNGAQVTALSAPAPPTPFPFTPAGRLRVGMNFDHREAEPAMDVWIDDLMLDTQPIGCTK